MEKGLESKENYSENTAFNSVKSVYSNDRIYTVQIQCYTVRCAGFVGSEGAFLHGQIPQWKAKIPIFQTVLISAASILYFFLAHCTISFRI